MPSYLLVLSLCFLLNFWTLGAAIAEKGESNWAIELQMFLLVGDGFTTLFTVV